MNNRKRFLAVTLGVTVSLLALIWLLRSPRQASADITLHAPPFADAGQTATLPSASFLLDEAGITAYVHLSQTIRLEYVQDEFRIIEDQTEDYIIGSVPVPEYDIEYDVHVHVHESGWMVAYYLPDDPVSKIVDWRNRRISPTNLETVLTNLAASDGIILPQVSYYDFRYPDATHLMLISKSQAGTYQVNVPSSFTFYERSWVVGVDQYFSASYILDGVALADVHGSYELGVLSLAQLLPDLLHTFEADLYIEYGFNTLVLIYENPNAAR